MGRRLTTGRDPNGPLADERYERDPPVMDSIKLSSTDINRMRDLADDLGVDGPRLVELLGAPRNGGPVDGDHVLPVDRQPELVGLLEEFMDRIADEIRTERDLEELAYEPRSTWEAILDEADHSAFRTYLKVRSIRNLVEFAHEHEITLSIE